MTRLEQVLAIDGMSRPYAEALLNMGLDTYWEIYRLREDTLVSKVEDAVDQGLVDSPIDIHTAVRWQKSAVRLSLTRFLDVKVKSHRYRQPLEGALVKAGDVEATTDASGIAQLSGVRVETTSIVVSKDGYFDLQIDVDLRPEKRYSYTCSLAASPTGARTPVFMSEYQGDFIEVGQDDHQRLRKRNIEELPDSAVLLYIEKDEIENTSTLVSLMREKDGDTIYTDRVEVDTSLLPSGADEGQLLEWQNGSFDLASYTREEFTRERAKRKFGFTSDIEWPKLIVEDVSASQLAAPVELPEIRFEDMSDQQKQAFTEAVNEYPDGIPLSVLRPILEGNQS